MNCFRPRSNSSNEQNLLNINGDNRRSYGTDSDLAIAWIGLKFYGRRNFKTVTLLDDINGSIDLGTITALMGPSGAGKSTLLKCINGRQISGIDGNTDIYLNSNIRIRSCFIVQDVKEHLLGGLTALQSLIYASKIKNMTIVCNHNLLAINLLKELNIGHIGNTTVSKCSGGEQKRLAIALELTAVGKPNLLCIDEPTSGLDSYAAEEVINCLKQVSERHKIAVVTSIHQPNNDVIMKFDKLYVLAKNGICVYEGSPQNLRNFLTTANIPCNRDQVPIEVLIKICSRSNLANNDYATGLSQLMLNKRPQLEARCNEQGQISDGITKESVRFFTKHMLFLMLRSFHFNLRSRLMAILFQFTLIIGLGYILTQLFNENIGEPDGCLPMMVNRTCNETESYMREQKWLSQNQRLHFFALLSIQFLVTVPTVLIFTSEVRIFFNEHKNGWYSTGSYFWAKTLVELPICLITSVCFAFIIYHFNNQIQEAFRFEGYIMVVTVGALTAQGLGFTIGIIADTDEKLANIMSVGVYLFNLLLCGFFAPIDELPDYIEWITYLSFAKQCFEMEMTYIYGFDRCPAGEQSQVLLNMNIDDKHKFVKNESVLYSHAVIIRIFALIILLIKANQIKLEQIVRYIKRLKRIFKTNRPDYQTINRIP